MRSNKDVNSSHQYIVEPKSSEVKTEGLVTNTANPTPSAQVVTETISMFLFLPYFSIELPFFLHGSFLKDTSLKLETQRPLRKFVRITSDTPALRDLRFDLMNTKEETLQQYMKVGSAEIPTCHPKDWSTIVKWVQPEVLYVIPDGSQSANEVYFTHNNDVVHFKCISEILCANNLLEEVKKVSNKL